MLVNFITLPFALLVAAGIMPVASIKWQFLAPPCRVLIYAIQSKKPLSSYPVEWQMIAHNAELFGNIPHYVDQTIGAIVGWVDISTNGEIPKIWSYGENLFRTFNAHTLDKPYFCNLKREGIDLRFAAEDFVSYQKKLAHPYGIGSTLLVPVNSRIWEQSAHGTIISIDLIGEASKWLITEDNALREYDSVVLYHNNMYREFAFSSRNCIMPHLDERGKVILYPSILRDGKKTARTSVVLYLEEELNR